MTVKTEKSKVFKRRSHSQRLEADEGLASYAAANLNGILKRPSVTSADEDSFRRADEQESTGSETVDEEQTK